MGGCELGHAWGRKGGYPGGAFSSGALTRITCRRGGDGRGGATPVIHVSCSLPVPRRLQHVKGHVGPAGGGPPGGGCHVLALGSRPVHGQRRQDCWSPQVPEERSHETRHRRGGMVGAGVRESTWARLGVPGLLKTCWRTEVHGWGHTSKIPAASPWVPTPGPPLLSHFRRTRVTRAAPHSEQRGRGQCGARVTSGEGPSFAGAACQGVAVASDKVCP